MAELQSLNSVPHTLQTVALATLIFAVCIFFSQINFYAQFRKIPAYTGNRGSSKKRQTAYLESARKFYEDGYKQVRLSRKSPSFSSRTNVESVFEQRLSHGWD